MIASLVAFFSRTAPQPAPLTPYQQGDADYERGLNVNPYPTGTPEATAWTEGHQDAHHAHQW